MLSSLNRRELTLASLRYLSLDCNWEHLPEPDEILEWFRLLEAGWVHGGDPKKPHAKLHSGKCSTGFFLCKKVLKFGNLREILAACIIKKLRQAGLCNVDGVYGAPYSSITLAADVARLLNVPNYIVEKGPKDDQGKDTMVFKSDDPIPAGSVLLRVEELITTLDSCNMATAALIAGNPHRVEIAPQIGALIYRPKKIQREQADGSVITAVVEREVDASDPPCDLCKQGSVPLPPKTEWAALTAK